MLPSSLRRLHLGCHFCQLLQVGSLPEGLLCLRFGVSTEWVEPLPPLQPGVLPSTLLAIDFADRYIQPLPAGVIPQSVRWVRLPSELRDLDDDEQIEVVLPPHAELSWFTDDRFLSDTAALKEDGSTDDANPYHR